MRGADFALFQHPLMPSTTMPTADAPIASMGWRTVVSDGV